MMVMVKMMSECRGAACVCVCVSPPTLSPLVVVVASARSPQRHCSICAPFLSKSLAILIDFNGVHFPGCMHATERKKNKDEKTEPPSLLLHLLHTSNTSPPAVSSSSWKPLALTQLREAGGGVAVGLRAPPSLHTLHLSLLSSLAPFLSLLLSSPFLSFGSALSFQLGQLHAQGRQGESSRAPVPIALLAE